MLCVNTNGVLYVKCEILEYDKNLSLIDNIISTRNVNYNYDEYEFMFGLTEAVDRIILAINNRENIGIMSDK